MTPSNVSALLKESDVDGTETPAPYVETKQATYQTNMTDDEWQQTEGSFETDWLAESLILLYAGFEGDIADWIITSDVGSSIGMSEWAYNGNYSLSLNDSMMVPTYNSVDKSPTSMGTSGWFNDTDATPESHDSQLIQTLLQENFECHPFTNWTISDGIYVNQNGTIYYAGNYSAEIMDYLIMSASNSVGVVGAGNGWNSPEYVNISDFQAINNNLFVEGFETYPFVNWDISDATFITQNGTIFYAGSFSAMIQSSELGEGFFYITEDNSPSSVVSGNGWTDPTSVYASDYQSSWNTLFSDSFETYPFSGWIVVETITDIEHIVDQQSNVGAPADIGTHVTSFTDMQSKDSSYDSLTEASTGTFDLSAEDDYDLYDTNVDDSPDLGTELNPENANGTTVDYQLMTLTEEDTSVVGGSEWLNVNAFENPPTYDSWDNKIGTDPYIDAQDGSNYIHEAKSNGASIGFFDFTDTTLSGTIDVNISIYCHNMDGVGDDYIEVYVDYTGSGSGSLVGTVGDHTNWQYDTISLGSHTVSEVNNLRVYFKTHNVGGGDDYYIDHARLGVLTATQENRQLDVEYQWSDADTSLVNADVCIFVNSTTGEDININYRNGGSWSSLGTISSTGWNNFTATGLTSTYTIQLVGSDDSGGDSTTDSWEIDLITLHTWENNIPNYELDLEVQWINVDYSQVNEELALYVGANNTENILVDVWYSSGWVNLATDLNANSWNNITITSFLDSDTFTIRFRDGVNSTDSTQSDWEIDVALIHSWSVGLASVSRDNSRVIDGSWAAHLTDGLGESVSMKRSLSAFDTDDYRVYEVFFNLASLSGTGTINFRWNDTADSVLFSIPSDRVATLSGTTGLSWTAGSPLALNNWYNLTVVYDRKRESPEVQVYLSDSLLDTATNPVLPTTFVITTPDTLSTNFFVDAFMEEELLIQNIAKGKGLVSGAWLVTGYDIPVESQDISFNITVGIMEWQNTGSTITVDIWDVSTSNWSTVDTFALTDVMTNHTVSGVTDDYLDINNLNVSISLNNANSDYVYFDVLDTSVKFGIALYQYTGVPSSVVSGNGWTNPTNVYVSDYQASWNTLFSDSFEVYPFSAWTVVETITDIEHEVNQTSSIDPPSDIGTHNSFGDMQSKDSTYDTLTEASTGTFDLSAEDDYDLYDTNVDGNPDLGTELNPANAQGTTVDYQLMTLTEEDTSVVGGSEWLDVNGFDSTYTGWDNLVGAPPHLNSQNYPTAYVHEVKTGGVSVGWFDFDPTSLSGSIDVNISMYCHNMDGVGDDYIEVYVDYTGSGSGSLVGTVGDHTNWQYDTISLGSHTVSEVNNLRVYFKTHNVGGGDDYYIDHARLGTSTATQQNRQIDLEYQWSDADTSLANADVCIFVNSTTGEDIDVNYRNGGSWSSLGTISATGWNNFTATGLTSTYTIQLVGTDDSGGDSNIDTWTIDLITLHTWEDNIPDYELDLEVQWINVDYLQVNEELALYVGTNDTEAIDVDVWNSTSSSWVSLLTDLNANSWENISITDHLTSDTFTIRFKDGTPSQDSTQSSWDIDVALIHSWSVGLASVSRDNSRVIDESWAARLTDGIGETVSMERTLTTFDTDDYRVYEIFFNLASLSGTGAIDFLWSDATDSVLFSIPSDRIATLSGTTGLSWTAGSPLTLDNWYNLTVVYDRKKGTPEVEVYLSDTLLDTATNPVLPTTFEITTPNTMSTDFFVDAFVEEELLIQNVAKGQGTVSGAWTDFGYDVPDNTATAEFNVTIGMMEWKNTGSTATIKIWDVSATSWTTVDTVSLSGVMTDYTVSSVTDDYLDIENLNISVSVSSSNWVYFDSLDTSVIVYPELSGSSDPVCMSRSLSTFTVDEYRTYEFMFYLESLNGTSAVTYRFNSTSGNSIVLTIDDTNVGTLTGSGFNENLGTISLGQWHNFTTIYDYRLGVPTVEFILDSSTSQLSTSPVIPDMFYVETLNQSGTMVYLDEFYEERLEYQGVASGLGLINGSWQGFGYNLPSDAYNIELDLTFGLFEWEGSGTTEVNVSIWDVSSGIWVEVGPITIDDVYQNYTLLDISIDDFQDINNLNVSISIDSTNRVYLDVIDSSVSYNPPKSVSMTYSPLTTFDTYTRRKYTYSFYLEDLNGTDYLVMSLYDGGTDSVVLSIDMYGNVSVSGQGFTTETITQVAFDAWYTVNINYDYRLGTPRVTVSINSQEYAVSTSPVNPTEFKLVTGYNTESKIFFDEFSETDYTYTGVYQAYGVTSGEWDGFGYSIPSAQDMELTLTLGMFALSETAVNVSIWNHTASAWTDPVIDTVSYSYHELEFPMEFFNLTDINSLKVKIATNATDMVYLDDITSTVEYTDYSIDPTYNTHTQAIIMLGEAIPRDLDNSTITMFVDIENIVGDANQSVTVQLTDVWTGNDSARLEFYANGSVYLYGDGLPDQPLEFVSLSIGTQTWYQLLFNYDLITTSAGTLKVQILDGTTVIAERDSSSTILIPSYLMISTPATGLGAEMYFDDLNIVNAVDFNGQQVSFRDTVAYARNTADGYWGGFGLDYSMPPQNVTDINFTVKMKMWSFSGSGSFDALYWDETLPGHGQQGNENWTVGLQDQSLSITPTEYSFEILNRDSSTFTEPMWIRINTTDPLVFIDSVNVTVSFELAPIVHLQEAVGFIILESPVQTTGDSMGTIQGSDVVYNTLTEYPIGYMIDPPTYNASTATIYDTYKFPEDPSAGYVHPTITACPTCYRPFWFDNDSDDDGLSDKHEVYGVYDPVAGDYVDIDIFPGQFTWTSQGLLPVQNTSGKTIYTVGDVINPRQPDTDGDTLTDYEELFYANGTLRLATGIESRSSPLIPDTDGDFLLDPKERLWTTDPNDIDTDDDQLFDNTEVHGNYYVPFNTSLHQFWQSYVYTYNETNPFGIDPFSVDPAWNVVGPELNPRVTDPNNPDTDGDEITDWKELNIWLTSPVNTDNDNDLLPDWDEASLIKVDGTAIGNSEYLEWYGERQVAWDWYWAYMVGLDYQQKVLIDGWNDQAVNVTDAQSYVDVDFALNTWWFDLLDNTTVTFTIQWDYRLDNFTYYNSSGTSDRGYRVYLVYNNDTTNELVSLASYSETAVTEWVNTSWVGSLNGLSPEEIKAVRFEFNADIKLPAKISGEPDIVAEPVFAVKGVVIKADYTHNDVTEITPETFIYSSPRERDFDGDELYDGREFLEMTNPYDADTDDDFLDDATEADGLAVYTNLDEVEIRSDPLNPDSDFDGLRDGEELGHTLLSYSQWLYTSGLINQYNYTDYETYLLPNIGYNKNSTDAETYLDTNPSKMDVYWTPDSTGGLVDVYRTYRGPEWRNGTDFWTRHKTWHVSGANGAWIDWDNNGIIEEADGDIDPFGRFPGNHHYPNGTYDITGSLYPWNHSVVITNPWESDTDGDAYLLYLYEPEPDAYRSSSYTPPGTSVLIPAGLSNTGHYDYYQSWLDYSSYAVPSEMLGVAPSLSTQITNAIFFWIELNTDLGERTGRARNSQSLDSSRKVDIRFQTPWWNDYLPDYDNDQADPFSSTFDLGKHGPTLPLDIFGVDLHDVKVVYGTNYDVVPDVTIDDIYDMSRNVKWETVYSDVPLWTPNTYSDETGFVTWDGAYINSYDKSAAEWHVDYYYRFDKRGVTGVVGNGPTRGPEIPTDHTFSDYLELTDYNQIVGTRPEGNIGFAGELQEISKGWNWDGDFLAEGIVWNQNKTMTPISGSVSGNPYTSSSYWAPMGYNLHPSTGDGGYSIGDGKNPYYFWTTTIVHPLTGPGVLNLNTNCDGSNPCTPNLGTDVKTTNDALDWLVANPSEPIVYWVYEKQADEMWLKKTTNPCDPQYADEWFKTYYVRSEVDHYPLHPDTDGDTVLDGYPTMPYYQSPTLDDVKYKLSNSLENYNRDLDGDGLFNALDTNSDNDAYSDTLEVGTSGMNTDMEDANSPYIFIEDVVFNEGTVSSYVDFTDYYWGSPNARIEGYITDSNPSFDPSALVSAYPTLSDIYIDRYGNSQYDEGEDFLIDSDVTLWVDGSLVRFAQQDNLVKMDDTRLIPLTEQYYVRAQLNTTNGISFSANTYSEQIRIDKDETYFYGQANSPSSGSYGTKYSDDNIQLTAYVYETDSHDTVDGVTVNWYYRPVGGSWVDTGVSSPTVDGVASASWNVPDYDDDYEIGGIIMSDSHFYSSIQTAYDTLTVDTLLISVVGYTLDWDDDFNGIGNGIYVKNYIGSVSNFDIEMWLDSDGDGEYSSGNDVYLGTDHCEACVGNEWYIDIPAKDWVDIAAKFPIPGSDPYIRAKVWSSGLLDYANGVMTIQHEDEMNLEGKGGSYGNKLKGDSIWLTATLTEDSNDLESMTIWWEYNFETSGWTDTTISAVTNTSGIATNSWTPPSIGSYEIRARFDGTNGPPPPDPLGSYYFAATQTTPDTDSLIVEGLLVTVTTPADHDYGDDFPGLGLGVQINRIGTGSVYGLVVFTWLDSDQSGDYEAAYDVLLNYPTGHLDNDGVCEEDEQLCQEAIGYATWDDIKVKFGSVLSDPYIRARVGGTGGDPFFGASPTRWDIVPEDDTATYGHNNGPPAQTYEYPDIWQDEGGSCDLWGYLKEDDIALGNAAGLNVKFEYDAPGGGYSWQQLSIESTDANGFASYTWNIGTGWTEGTYSIRTSFVGTTEYGPYTSTVYDTVDIEVKNQLLINGPDITHPWTDGYIQGVKVHVWTVESGDIHNALVTAWVDKDGQGDKDPSEMEVVVGYTDLNGKVSIPDKTWAEIVAQHNPSAPGAWDIRYTATKSDHFDALEVPDETYTISKKEVDTFVIDGSGTSDEVEGLYTDTTIYGSQVIRIEDDGSPVVGATVFAWMDNDDDNVYDDPAETPFIIANNYVTNAFGEVTLDTTITWDATWQNEFDHGGTYISRVKAILVTHPNYKYTGTIAEDYALDADSIVMSGFESYSTYDSYDYGVIDAGQLPVTLKAHVYENDNPSYPAIQNVEDVSFFFGTSSTGPWTPIQTVPTVSGIATYDWTPDADEDPGLYYIYASHTASGNYQAGDIPEVIRDTITLRIVIGLQFDLPAGNAIYTYNTDTSQTITVSAYEDVTPSTRAYVRIYYDADDSGTFNGGDYEIVAEMTDTDGYVTGSLWYDNMGRPNAGTYTSRIRAECYNGYAEDAPYSKHVQVNMKNPTIVIDGLGTAAEVEGKFTDITIYTLQYVTGMDGATPINGGLVNVWLDMNGNNVIDPGNVGSGGEENLVVTFDTAFVDGSVTIGTSHPWDSEWQAAITSGELWTNKMAASFSSHPNYLDTVVHEDYFVDPEDSAVSGYESEPGAEMWDYGTKTGGQQIQLIAHFYEYDSPNYLTPQTMDPIQFRYSTSQSGPWTDISGTVIPVAGIATKDWTIPTMLDPGVYYLSAFHAATDNYYESYQQPIDIQDKVTVEVGVTISWVSPPTPAGNVIFTYNTAGSETIKILVEEQGYPSDRAYAEIYFDKTGNGRTGDDIDLVSGQVDANGHLSTTLDYFTHVTTSYNAGTYTNRIRARSTDGYTGGAANKALEIEKKQADFWIQGSGTGYIVEGKFRDGVYGSQTVKVWDGTGVTGAIVNAWIDHDGNSVNNEDPVFTLLTSGSTSGGIVTMNEHINYWDDDYDVWLGTGGSFPTYMKATMTHTNYWAPVAVEDLRFDQHASFSNGYYDIPSTNVYDYGRVMAGTQIFVTGHMAEDTSGTDPYSPSGSREQLVMDIKRTTDSTWTLGVDVSDVINGVASLSVLTSGLAGKYELRMYHQHSTRYSASSDTANYDYAIVEITTSILWSDNFDDETLASNWAYPGYVGGSNGGSWTWSETAGGQLRIDPSSAGTGLETYGTWLNTNLASTFDIRLTLRRHDVTNNMQNVQIRVYDTSSKLMAHMYFYDAWAGTTTVLYLNLHDSNGDLAETWNSGYIFSLDVFAGVQVKRLQNGIIYVGEDRSSPYQSDFTTRASRTDSRTVGKIELSVRTRNDYFVDGAYGEFDDFSMTTPPPLNPENFDDGNTNGWVDGGSEGGTTFTASTAQYVSPSYSGYQAGSTGFWRRDRWEMLGTINTQQLYYSWTRYWSASFYATNLDGAIFYLVKENGGDNDYIKCWTNGWYFYIEAKTGGVVRDWTRFNIGNQWANQWVHFEIKLSAGQDDMWAQLAWKIGSGSVNIESMFVLDQSMHGFDGYIELESYVRYGDVYWDNIRYASTKVGGLLASEAPVEYDNIQTSRSIMTNVYPDDYYMWTSTFNWENVTDIVLNETIMSDYNNTSKITIQPKSVTQYLGNDMWQVVNLIETPSNIGLGYYYLNTIYTLSLKNGTKMTVYVPTGFDVINSTSILQSPCLSIYNSTQAMYDALWNFDYRNLTSDEQITLLNQLRFIHDLAQFGYYDEFNDYINEFNVSELIESYLNANGTDNIALITGVSDYAFTHVNSMDMITNDYLHQIINLTSQGYHVYWNVNEFMNEELLNKTLNTIDQYDTVNTTFYYAWTGHVLQGNLNPNNNDTLSSLKEGDQKIVLMDGSTITDKALYNYLEIIDSQNQFFIINSCYAEGLVYDLKKSGRIILASTSVLEVEWVPTFSEYSAFYQLFIDNWDSNKSIEENYQQLTSSILSTRESRGSSSPESPSTTQSDEILYNPVLFDDDDKTDRFM